MAAGKVGFHFAQSNKYLLGNDINDDKEDKLAKELLINKTLENKNKSQSGVVVSLKIFQSQFTTIIHLILHLILFIPRMQ